MRTIIFYSYKGGTGRTFTAVNLALVLVRFGKSVCLLDFDLEAPGVVEKLKRAGFPLSHKNGFVDYIGEHLKDGDAGSISKKAQPIKPATGSGHLHVIGAGDICSADYFKLVSSEKWARYFGGEAVGGVPGRIDSFMADLKRHIVSDLRPAPDYLLVDSRSGINEFSGICTRFLPNDRDKKDTVVLFTLGSEESYRGTRRVLEGFEIAEKTGKPFPTSKRLVLSRVPSNYTKYHAGVEEFHAVTVQERTRKMRDARSRCIEGLELKKEDLPPIDVVRNDGRIQDSEELVFDLEGKALVSPVADDLKRFFIRLLPEFSELGGELEGIVQGYVEQRTFLLRSADGRLYNPEDQSPNVAFRVDTLNRTLRRLYAAIEDPSWRSDLDGDQRAAAAFCEAGYDAAEAFSADLRSLWRKTSSYELSLGEKLRQWCKFDSTVGFGKFDYQLSGSSNEGRVSLAHSFLGPSKKKQDGVLVEGQSIQKEDLSPFMIGYITRILQAVFGVEHRDMISVTHTFEEEDTVDKEVPTSIFHFVIEGVKGV